MGVFSLHKASFGPNAFCVARMSANQLRLYITVVIYVAMRTDLLVDTLADITHKPFRIRARELSFSCVDFDIYDANDIINCIKRSL